jgi:hypothetical protein
MDFFLVADSRQVYNGCLSDFHLESGGLQKSIGVTQLFGEQGGRDMWGCQRDA